MIPQNLTKENPFTFVEDPERKELLQKTVAQIKEFREVEFKRYDCETLLDAVHDLYEGHRYIDRLTDYPRYFQSLFEAFARPEVNQVLSKHIRCLDGVLDMLSRLFDFSMRLDNEIFQTLILAYNIECYPDEYSDKQLTELLDSFKEKTRSAKTGKVTRIF